VRTEERYGIMQRTVSLLSRRKAGKTQKSASRRSWLAGRKCKQGSVQVRMILNRNITNISNRCGCFFHYFFIIANKFTINLKKTHSKTAFPSIIFIPVGLDILCHHQGVAYLLLTKLK
jgi:hypothetical protein